MDLTSLVVMSLVIAVIVMANLGERWRGWRIAAYLSMASLGLAAAALGLLFLLLVVAQRFSPATAPGPAELDPGRLGLWLLFGGLLSLVLLLPPVRRGLAGIIPIRPDSVVNAVALAFLAILLTQSMSLGGLGPQGFVALTGELTMLQVVLSELPLALVGILGVGFPSRRPAAGTWERLGIRGLTWRQAGLTLVGLVGLLAFEVAFNAVASRVSPQELEEVSRASTQLYARLGTPLSAAAVSLASGTAEEILFRGALQPRLGLLLTAFAFGIIHSQYGIGFALLSVGVVGLVLGLYRQRVNTTACILIHSLYNLTLFLLSGL